MGIDMRTAIKDLRTILVGCKSAPAKEALDYLTYLEEQL